MGTLEGGRWASLVPSTTKYQRQVGTLELSTISTNLVPSRSKYQRWVRWAVLSSPTVVPNFRVLGEHSEIRYKLVQTQYQIQPTTMYVQQSTKCWQVHKEENPRRKLQIWCLIFSGIIIWYYQIFQNSFSSGTLIWFPQVPQGGQEELQADWGGCGLLGLPHQLHQGGD